jgi:hypothetical protein
VAPNGVAFFHSKTRYFWSGELGKAVRRNKKKDELDVVIDFLCKYVSFGSLDIMVQRAVMSMDDL